MAALRHHRQPLREVLLRQLLVAAFSVTKVRRAHQPLQLQPQRPLHLALVAACLVRSLPETPQQLLRQPRSLCSALLRRPQLATLRRRNLRSSAVPLLLPPQLQVVRLRPRSHHSLGVRLRPPLLNRPQPLPRQLPRALRRLQPPQHLACSVPSPLLLQKERRLRILPLRQLLAQAAATLSVLPQPGRRPKSLGSKTRPWKTSLRAGHPILPSTKRSSRSKLPWSPNGINN